MAEKRTVKLCNECGARHRCLHKHSSYKRAWYVANRAACIKRTQTRYAKNRESILEQKHWYHFKRAYNLTQDEYEARLAKQDNVCAMCNKPTNKIVVDHDHKTNVVRGLICPRCNLVLSFMDEVGDWRTIIETYLKGDHDGACDPV